MKSFCPYLPEQTLLMPPSLREWVPEGHLARFIEELSEQLDLSEIYGSYQGDGRGQSAYHPLLMVRVLFYGYATGRYSSRKLERATYEDVPTRYLGANQHPDHSRIAEFRRRHLEALGRLFGQILKLCARAGLVKLGRVAIDGTKMKANASRFKARTYEQMQEEEKRLDEEIQKWLQAAERTDAAEDEQYGPGRRGDELPPELATREQRLKLIRELKTDLEREAREKAERKRAEVEKHLQERQREEQRRGRRWGGRVPKLPDPEQAKPKPTAQRNLIDPDSRIMKDKATNSFQQAYNAQVAVDEKHQVIIAAAVTQQEHDREQMIPLLKQAEQHLGQKPQVVLADSGYWNPQTLGDEYLQSIDVYVPPEGEHWVRHRGHASRWARNPELLDRLRTKMKTEAAREQYRARQGIVEPVFGGTKQARGFRQFLMRGVKKVTAEWKLICATHNALKLFRAGGLLLLTPDVA